MWVMDHPTRREFGLLRQPLDDELLLFDTERSRAHSLNATAAAVWQACDGERDHEELAAHCGIDEPTLELALARLQAAHLLQGDSARTGDGAPAQDSAPAGVSRRVMIRRSLASGAALGVAIPVIRSITAPTAAMAASNGRIKGQAGKRCTNNSQCSPSSFCQQSAPGAPSCQRGVGISCSHTSSCLHNTNSTYACITGHCGHCTSGNQCPAGYNCSASICKR
jgi:hypothetical protein